MKANSIYFENFRGGTKQLDLSGVDIITGPNGIGKTRILQAIELAVTGNVSHPIEERNIDMIELFSREIGTNNLVVDLGLDAGEHIIRSFEMVPKDDKISVSERIEFPLSPETKLTEAKKKVKMILGDLPMMFDVNKFIRLSDEKRAEMLMRFGFFNREKWSEEAIRERLFGYIYANQLETGIVETAFKVVNGTLREDARTGLEALREYFKKEESSLKKESKGMSATAQGAVKLNVTDGKTSLRPAQTIREEMGKVNDDHFDLSSKIAQGKASKEQFDKLQDEKKSLTDKKAVIQNNMTPERLASLRIKAEEVKALIREVPSELKVELQNIEGSIQEVETHIADARTKETTAKVNIETMQRQRILLAEGKCPTCGQECGDVRDSIDDQIQSAIQELGEISNEVTAFTQRRSALVEERVKINDQIQTIELKSRAAERSYNDIVAQILSMEGTLAHIEVLENRLKEIDAYKHDNTLDIDEAELQRQALSNRLAILQTELNDRIAYDTKILQAKEAAAAAKKADATLKTVKAMQEQLRSMKWEIVREALEPIREKAAKIFTANQFGKSAEFDFLFEDARGNEVFKFGWKIDNELGNMFVDFDSLSTAQQLFTLVAVLAPLIELGNPKFRILTLDNCEVVSDEYRAAFIEELVRAKELCLDNIVVASSGRFTEDCPLCDGKGKLIGENTPCARCKGTGEIGVEEATYHKLESEVTA